ncbi:MAG: Asp-tRNA(Asn)/Glu-tRNA(Gln) amidotransferase subunit GatA [Phycisphaerales bacterium]|nr:MAG: Asp-tRNA(Asn)/Glu-tRNA(Gln) amidotransferase subunit GatA [Phycisphaerales bacterium]
MTGLSTIYELAAAFRAKQRSAEDITRDCLDRIEAAEPSVHAFVSCDRAAALAHASQLDAARRRGEKIGPLAGVPVAIKDNICTTVGATTCGSQMLEGYQSVYNAHVVDRLEAAGAIVIGKTNLDAFAMGSSTETSHHPTTRNPWDKTCVAGGSSGGSAAAVAAREVPGALGSDTGGSIRQPASYCGVVGLKPTYGRVSRFGLVAFASSLDQIGPIATNVRDVALLLNVIAGQDKCDSTSADGAVPDFESCLERPLQGLRIGISDEYFCEGLHAEVDRAVRAALELYQAEGTELVPIELPHMKYAVACYYIVAPAEASSNLARYDGVHYGYRAAKPEDIVDLYSSSRGEGFCPEVKRRIMLGTYVLSSGYYEQYYLKAMKVRTLIKEDFDNAFRRVDVIASPVAPTTAFRIGEKLDDPLAMYLTDVYTVSANLAGICAISIPCGFDKCGLPIGLQLMGPAFGEEILLAAAHQYQLRTDHHTKLPGCGD